MQKIYYYFYFYHDPQNFIIKNFYFIINEIY